MPPLFDGQPEEAALILSLKADGATGAPPAPARTRSVTNLPAPLTHFIGREREMAEVERLLGTARLLTLTGSSGAGKTRLAYDPRHPVMCFDGKSLQLLGDLASRSAGTVQAGRPRRQDYEYVRHGTRNIFLWVEPKAGHRYTLVTSQRTKADFAKAMRYLVDVLYPAAYVEQIDLVIDNLNTHTTDTLIEIFGKPEADRILSRLVFHYTPLHASWTNMAEIEFSAMTSQCLDRRIPDEWTLASELVAWELRRNQRAEPIRWPFTWKRAKRLSIEREPDAAVTST